MGARQHPKQRSLLGAAAAVFLVVAMASCSDNTDLTRTSSNAQPSGSSTALSTDASAAGSTAPATDPSTTVVPVTDAATTVAPAETTIAPVTTPVVTSTPLTVPPQPATTPPTVPVAPSASAPAAPPTIPPTVPVAPATVPPTTAPSAPQTGPCPYTSHDSATVAACGDSTELVRTVQNLLICAGYSVTADGSFGPATYRAVVAFQTMHGLTPDGLAGHVTQDALNGTCDPGAGDY
ncbi:MAG: putative bifunctional protein precursor : N-acetylmuramoyl-L-alanine amidase [Ilumatobacteraceae bacterium]|nr:putative bifunctional protein precursor : N-acetylmuramoyl-L-alanine amidase [Ilumatobacteraceae bacterium]MCU1388045.1 putative bifunctional protein precursor : N-acetylmuramoyl-L-alanine amidase [Ilumatobacteraceae bacterium]